MNKLFVGLFCISLLFTQSHYYGSTTAPVTLAGGIIKAKHVQEATQKYKRKDCPVCKGKGYYISGDKITRVDCGYCEADKTGSVTNNPIIVHKQNCPNGICPTSPTGAKNGR